jgi:hypothetical protein
MGRILSNLVPLMAVMSVPGIVLAAGRVAEACCCCPLCCSQSWL